MFSVGVVGWWCGCWWLAVGRFHHGLRQWRAPASCDSFCSGLFAARHMPAAAWQGSPEQTSEFGNWEICTRLPSHSNKGGTHKPRLHSAALHDARESRRCRTGSSNVGGCTESWCNRQLLSPAAIPAECEKACLDFCPSLISCARRPLSPDGPDANIRLFTALRAVPLKSLKPHRRMASRSSGSGLCHSDHRAHKTNWQLK